jgi:hypothetical protein
MRSLPHVDEMVLNRLQDKCTLFFICLRLGTRSSFCLFYAFTSLSGVLHILSTKKDEVLGREEESNTIKETTAESGRDITYWCISATSPR